MTFEKHQRPNVSRLEIWRKDITEMRAAKWPYRRIAKWLEDEKQHQISVTAIRNFCLIREIAKPGSEPFRKSKSEGTRLPSNPEKDNPKKKLFDYDDSGPINLDVA
ncbi:hypothetical protein AAFN60_19035 [Roseibacillus persicicus]|uniref:hypothetical protein n=1 Tax=Roseibacillus persicicus TaxID=454148 RepID=UPI00398BB4BF